MRLNERQHHMRRQFFAVVLGGLATGLVLSQVPLSLPARSQDAGGGSKTAPPASELDSLKTSASEFEKAYNAGDAKAIAAQFAEHAEVIDDGGQVIAGRAGIEARFAALFKEHPQARIAVELTSLRQISPDAAVEDGYSTTTLSPDQPGSRSAYTVVHVKRDGRWQIASVRDFLPENAAEPTARDQLQTLEWLVGHWVDESPDGRVETTCRWSDDGNYLLQDYVVKARRGAVNRGTQRIAWDPLRRTIRSWAFDHSGAFTEATWTPVENGWVLKAEGVTPDGHGVSVTRVVTPISADSFQIDSTSLVVGRELVPDSSVRVVRRPPPPAE